MSEKQHGMVEIKHEFWETDQMGGKFQLCYFLPVYYLPRVYISLICKMGMTLTFAEIK